MTRRRPRNRRRVETRIVELNGVRFAASIGYHDNGAPAEVWCDPPPGMSGSAMDFLAKDAATVISVAMQWGVPMADLVKSIARVSTGPATIIGALLDAIETDTGPGPMPKGWKPRFPQQKEKDLAQ
jgi:hypothetical protein